MTSSIYCYDPTISDEQSKVRGVGRYLQILHENFPDWNFTNNLKIQQSNNLKIFINPFFNFLQNPFAIRRIAKKQIAVIHDLIPLKYAEHFPFGIRGKLNIFLNKLALKNYDLIVTDSEVSKKDIIDKLKVKSEKVKVIYPCLPKIFIESKSEILNPKPKTNNNFLNSNFQDISNFDIRASSFCVYVGDATWNKNLVNLAKAIKEINVTCIFVGKVFEEKTRELVSSQSNKWLDEYREFISVTKDDKRFIFKGFVSDEQLIQLYQNARCNILVSHDEGFGFSYLEAASQSCPSVLSDISVFKEISANQGAIYANLDQSNDLANAIGELYFKNDVRNTLGIAAKRRAEFFDRNRFKKEFQKVLVSNI